MVSVFVLLTPITPIYLSFLYSFLNSQLLAIVAEKGREVELQDSIIVYFWYVSVLMITFWYEWFFKGLIFPVFHWWCKGHRIQCGWFPTRGLLLLVLMQLWKYFKCSQIASGSTVYFLYDVPFCWALSAHPLMLPKLCRNLNGLDISLWTYLFSLTYQILLALYPHTLTFVLPLTNIKSCSE